MRKVNNCSEADRKKLHSLASNFICPKCLTNDVPKQDIDDPIDEGLFISVSSFISPDKTTTNGNDTESDNRPAPLPNASPSCIPTERTLNATERKRKQRLKLKLTALSISDDLAKRLLTDSSFDLSNFSNEIQTAIRSWRLEVLHKPLRNKHADNRYHTNETYKEQQLKRQIDRLQNPDKRSANLENVRQRLMNTNAKERNLQLVKKRLRNPVNMLKNLKNSKIRKRTFSWAKPTGDQRKSCESRLSIRNRNLVVLWAKWIDDFCLQFVCVCCRQLRYRHQVTVLDEVLKSKLLENGLLKNTLTGHTSVNGEEYTCNHCFSYLKKLHVPPESIKNGFDYHEIDREIENLHFGEEKLVSLRIPFMCIMARPQGGQLACKGSVINIPSDFPVTVTTIPRPLLQKELIGIQFMRRISDFNPHFTRFVRIQTVKSVAKKLINCQLYLDSNVSLNDAWDATELLQRHSFLTEDPSDSSKDVCPEVVDDCGIGCFDSVTDDFVDYVNPEKFYRVAPGEKSMPLSIFTDDYAEEASFPSVFGGRGRPSKRLVPVTYGTIAKAETRSVFNRFQKPQVIFFKNKKIKIKQIYSKINIALRKLTKGKADLTAFDIKHNKILNTMAKNDKCYAFLKNQRFSPQWYQALQKDLMAEIRQKGKATWFFTLSSAESFWPDLLKVLYNAKHPDGPALLNDELLALSFHEKSELIKCMPALVATHFHHRLHWFLTNVLKRRNGVLGNMEDYSGTLEAQFRGSLHGHFLGYVKNAPVVDKDSDITVCDFIDRFVCCRRTLPDLPGVTLNDSDKDLPQKRQLHTHKSTCFKGNRPQCRFGFDIPPMPATIIIRPGDCPDFSQSENQIKYSRLKTFMQNKVVNLKNPTRLVYLVHQILDLISSQDFIFQSIESVLIFPVLTATINSFRWKFI